MKKLSVLIDILFFLTVISSNTMASDILNLKESINIALKKSLSVQSAEEEVKAREFEEKASKADFYPKISTSYSYTRLDNSTVTDAKYTLYTWDPGSNTHFPLKFEPVYANTYQFNITATQPIFTGWSLTITRQLASLGVDIAKIQKEKVAQDLVLNVKKAYFGILKAEKLKDLALQAVEQLKAHLRVSNAFYEEGIIAKNDLLETEVEMAQAQQNLISAGNRLEIAYSLFNTLLRQDLAKKITIEDILEYHPVNITLDLSIKNADQHRPEINELLLNIESAEKAVELTKSAYYPAVSLVGNYQRETNDVLLNPITGEDPDNWSVTLQAEWTFWEWGKKKYNVAAANAYLAKASHLLEEFKDNIHLEVKDAYLLLREAEKNIQVTRTAIIQAEENFRMNEERYKQQVATSTNVLDAQTLLTRARSNYFNALSDYNISWARLERAMGIIDKGDIG